jgi:hypothetical protein
MFLGLIVFYREPTALLDSEDACGRADLAGHDQ